MKDGFIKAAAIVPSIRVADTEYNAEQIITSYREAVAAGAKIIVFPELCITGYTCHDLFLQGVLLDGATRALNRIREATKGEDALVFVGYPLVWEGKLYNTAAVLQDGKLLAFIPKRFMPNYAEFYELRQFTEGPADAQDIVFQGELRPFGSRILFDIDAIPGLAVAAEICEDAWVINPPDTELAQAGATVIVNLSASNETVGKDDYRKVLFSAASSRTLTDYIYVSAGDGESTQDIVFGGRVLIYENGSLLGESKIFDNQYGETKIVYADLDISRMVYERRRMTTFRTASDEDYLHLDVHMEQNKTDLDRVFDAHPFVPHDKARRDQRCQEILAIQARGLAKRMQHIGCGHAVLGISGGLDSTLALLVTVTAFDLLGIPRENILSVTMPCFGTTDRTYHNACVLSTSLGTTLQEVNIKAAVMQHFADIEQDMSCHDVTYENGQARERTQVIMDLANKVGGIVIGTGDLSELALGWATYNGDHMSMYGVNAGVPKTLVRHLVQYFADTSASMSCHDVTYENGQARERTQVIMDLANKVGGIVIGTGDLSELALGWATYNGDHMSMYGVNAGVPKTLVRHLVQYFADTSASDRVKKVLLDVLDTPVSPELLPPTGDGKISQRTEDLVGPYELHDFYLYYMLRCAYSPSKIYRIARRSFAGVYDNETILKWERNFYKRFFAQQFKRSCLPDSPKVGSVAVSPRGDLRMPSDASRNLWMAELETLH